MKKALKFSILPLLIIALAMMASGCGETGQGSAKQSTTGTGGTGSVAVKNGSSSYQIVELYIAPSTSTSWGENLLSSAISAGSTRTISDLPADTYDLWAVFSNSGEYEQYEFIVASGQTYQVTATPSSTQPPATTGSTGSVAVKNGSSTYQIVELYIAPSTSTSWGENRIASDISSGSTRTITNIAVGTNDLLAVFSNAGEYEHTQFTVASGQTYEVIADPILLETELLMGKWHFVYTIGGTTFTNDYTLADIDGSKNNQGGYYIYGTGQSGDLVNAAYFPTDGNWALLDPGTTIDRFFTFYTDGSTILANSCYYHEDKSTGIMTSCYALTGSKTAALAAPEAYQSIMFGQDDEFKALSAADAIEADESVKRQYNVLKMLSK